MKAYRVRTGAILEILGDPIRETPILDLTLERYQEQACREAGLELVDVKSEDEIRDGAPHVVFRDDLFFTSGYLRLFVKGAGEREGNAVAALPPTGQWKALGALQDHVTIGDTEVRYEDFRYVDPRAADPAARPILFDTETGYYWRQRWLAHVLPGVTETFHPVTDRYLLQIIIPMHVGIANLWARFDRISRFYRNPAMEKVWDFMTWIARKRNGEEALRKWVDARMHWRARRGIPRLAYWIMGLRWMNHVGKDCDIHPSVIMEGCDIGNNVRVGANAYLQHATIGDGCEIGEYCHLRLCSIGEGTLIPQISRVSATVVYPYAFFATRSVNFGIIGREAQIYNSLYSDFRLDGTSQTTIFRGKVVDAKVPFLGVTVGHRARVAGGLITAPGRVIPNGVTILPPKDLVFVKAPKGVKEGDIIRLGEE